MPEIDIKNLTFTYENRDLPALGNVNVRVEKGDFILLAGQSGSGKSTLIKCVNGLIPARYLGVYSGEVTVAGRLVAITNMLDLSLNVGTVLQEVEKQMVSPMVEDEVAFGPSNLALPRDVIEQRVNLAISSSGLADLRKRFTFALSGGQKQRLAIADIVAMEPTIVLFDEPLANLDSEGVRLMQDTFRKLVEQGKTVVVAEHRTEEVLKAGPSRVVVMDRGRVVADSEDPHVLVGYANVLNVPAEYAIAGRKFAPFQGPEHAPSREPGEGLVECRDVSVEYPGGVKAIEGVSLEIRRGERVALLGNNGAGKSTLALAVTGLLKPSLGTVLVKGRDTKDMLVAEVARTIAVVFQSPFLMLFSKTVRDELSFGPKNVGMPRDEVLTSVSETARECGVDHLLDGSPYASSFGEKKRICVGSVLTMRPECVILDEPTSGQDYASCTRFMDFISSIRGKSFVIITHDPDLAINYTDRAIVMHQGRVLADGPTKRILASEEVLKEAAIRETSLISLSKKYTGGEAVLSTAELAEVSAGGSVGPDIRS